MEAQEVGVTEPEAGIVQGAGSWPHWLAHHPHLLGKAVRSLMRVC